MPHSSSIFSPVVARPAARRGRDRAGGWVDRRKSASDPKPGRLFHFAVEGFAVGWGRRFRLPTDFLHHAIKRRAALQQFAQHQRVLPVLVIAADLAQPGKPEFRIERLGLPVRRAHRQGELADAAQP